MEEWKNGMMEKWNDGIMEYWKNEIQTRFYQFNRFNNSLTFAP